MASRSRTKTASTSSDNPSQSSVSGSPRRNPNRLSNLSQGSLSSRSTRSGRSRSVRRAPSEAVELKRGLGLVTGIALIVGTMIGSGIFISPQGVAEGSGSVGLSLLVWLLGGVVSLCGSLSFAELGTMIPKSGGEYAYLRTALGDLPAYMFAWVCTTVLRPAAVAIMALTSAEYITTPLFEGYWCGQPPVVVKKIMAALMISAVSYAELGAMVVKSGAEYSYLLDAFGSMQGLLGPLPAFLFSWTNTIVLRPAQVAIISLTFATYSLEPFHDVCDINEGAQKCLAALCILVITSVNCFSVRLAGRLQIVFTVAKLLAIVIIVLGGFVKLGEAFLAAVNASSVPRAATLQVVFMLLKLTGIVAIIVGGQVAVAQGYTEFLETKFTNTETSPGKIAIAFYNSMWAYDGWNNLNYVTEELKNPSRNLPLAILIGIPLVTLCYVMVNISYFTVMPVEELINTPAVAITWGNRVLGVMTWLIPVSVALSTFGATNGTLFGAGRLTYVAAREGHTVQILSMVHVKMLTPLPSLIFTSLLALLFIIPADISSLIEFFNFAVWFFYGGTMVALLVLRYRKPNADRPFKAPIILPILVLLASLFLVVAPIVDNPRIEFLYAFLFIAGGLVFYFPFVYYGKYPNFMDRITEFFQLLFQVSAPIMDDHLPGESFT